MALILAVSFVFGLTAMAAKTDPMSFQIKKLYSAPTPESKSVYDIPIEVKLLDISEDANWYKVQITFCLGPARFSYEGWTQIPVGEILAERQKAVPIIENLTENPK